MFGDSNVLRKVLGGAFVSILIACSVMSSPASANHLDANNNLKSYTTDLNGAYAFGDDFCQHRYSVGDYVWITATDGGNVIRATVGDTTVGVTVHYGGRYCRQDWPTNAYSDFTSTTGSIAGKTSNYGLNTDPNLRFSGSQPGTLNISGQRAGQFDVCMTLTTTTTPLIVRVASPSACTRLVLDIQYPWTTDGQSLIGVNHDPNVVTWPADPPPPDPPALPGSVLKWNHKLWNNSGYDMNRTIYWSVRQSGFSGSASWRNGSADPQGWNKGGANGSANRPFVDEGPVRDATEYTVSQDDVGRRLCQWLVWTPKVYNELIDTQPTGMSSKACTDVPYRFNLEPSIEPIGGSAGLVVEPGATISTVRPKVYNSGPTKSYDNTAWQLSRIVVLPGITPPAGTDNGTDPCVYYRAGGSTCRSEANTPDKTFGTGDTIVNQLNNIAVGNMTAGQKLCFALSVQKYDVAHQNNNGQWRHSTPMCVTIGKKPKVQVWGHDLRTRSQIDTGVTEVDDGGTRKLFGSWVEYGGFSAQANSGFASGSGLNGGNTNTDDSTDMANVWNKLTFANVDESSPFKTRHGFYTLPNGLPTITDQFLGSSSGGRPSSDLTAVESGTYNVGDFTITGGQIADTGGKGKVIIIVSTETVKIEGNIIYKGVGGSSDVFTAIDQLPQVIIIAKNIEITGDVTQIDAWLLALDKSTPTSGSINTCSDVSLAADLTLGDCKNALTVNGPVVTRHLHLRRTAGSDSVATVGTPAEVFNLRPDTFLWAQARAGQAGKAQTVYSVELPPRF